MSVGIRRVRTAWAVAALGSGLPSTLCSLAAGDDLLGATRAAGTLLPGRRLRPNVLGGVVAHTAISTLWTAVFVAIEWRRRWTWWSGAVAGLAIAALDLELIGRRYPHVAALASVPQWLDHVAFGALLGAMLGRPANRQVTTRQPDSPSAAATRHQVPTIP